MANWHDYVTGGKGIPEWPYRVQYDKEQGMETDVHVRGGGIAGSWAATVVRAPRSIGSTNSHGSSVCSQRPPIAIRRDALSNFRRADFDHRNVYEKGTGQGGGAQRHRLALELVA